MKKISAELPFNSTCNLDCVYCYIPKNKALQKINRVWSEKVKDGSLIEMLSKIYGKNLEALSLWGGEPSLGYRDLTDFENLISTFPKLNSINTSSNFSNAESHIYLLNNLNDAYKKYNKSIIYSLQISIDGIDEFNDKNRGVGLSKRIRENIVKLSESSKNWTNIRLSLFNKSTFSEEEFKYFVNNEEKLKEHILFFKNLNEYVKSLNWGVNTHIDFTSTFSLALPGSYTKQDGIDFYNFHKLYKELDNDLGLYYARIQTFLKNMKRIKNSRINETTVCSAGQMMLAPDLNGVLHGCHSSFWYNFESYLNETEKLEDWNHGDRIYTFRKQEFKDLTKSVIADSKDSFQKSRLEYILSGFGTNLELRISMLYSQISVLAKAGQLSEIYLQREWAQLLAYFLAEQLVCWAHSWFGTGSLYAFPTSMIRIFGNGAFEFLVEEYIDRTKDTTIRELCE